MAAGPNNCADFDRLVLNTYFPKTFGRTIFPDAGITTPKHLTYQLLKYSKKHPEAELTVLEIPQVPGFRRKSRNIHGVAESLFANGYVIPIVFTNPYVAGGLLADYLVRGRYPVIPKNTDEVAPDRMEALTDHLAPKPTQQESLVEAVKATDKPTEVPASATLVSQPGSP
jgi:hypothetical protein